MHLNGWAAGFVVLVCGLGGFLGGMAAIYRYLVKPIAKFIEDMQDWRTIPGDVTKLQEDLKSLSSSLIEHITQTEERLTAVEPPTAYRRRRREVQL